MQQRTSTLAWVLGYTERAPGDVPNTYTATYHLSHLIQQGYISLDEGYAFLEETGLRDFKWQIIWPEDYETPDEMLITRLDNEAQGYVVFVHGWTGNHEIWEDLPGMVTLSNRRLVSISVDHNGFGDTRFDTNTPALDACNPPAAMRTLQKWIDLMRLRRQPGEIHHKVINLVGHSMGGAMLFYLNPIVWNDGEVTRYSLSPALLLEDEQYRRFYTTLGLGIGILQRVSALKIFERMIKPTMIEVLCAGASENVKRIHSYQYNETPRGITGSTFMAMGRLDDYEIARNWEFFRVMLGHRDRLVGLTGMMDLLSLMEFPAANLRVVPGTHYMFSVGTEDPQNAFQHAQNRELVVQDILTLHERALTIQLKGRLYG